MGSKPFKEQKNISAKYQYDIAYKTLVDKITDRILESSRQGHNVCEVKFTGEFVNFELVLDYFRNLGYTVVKDEKINGLYEYVKNTNDRESGKIGYKIYWGPKDYNSFDNSFSIGKLNK